MSIYSLSAVMALAGVIFAFQPQSASAASLSQVMVRFDRLATSQGTTGTVCAKPTTATVEASVQVTFPTGYTMGALGTFTTNVTNLAWPTGATAWLGSGNATAVAGQVVTFPSTDLVVGTLYCFNWTAATAVQVKATATSNNTGTVTTRDSGLATIDTAPYSTVSIANDQISVSATVAQTFSFALGPNTDALGTLSTGAVTTSPSPNTATINSNAGTGWVVLARDTNAGLRSPSTSYTIPSATSTLTLGTEGHNFGVTSSQVGGSGTITLPAAFDGTVTAHGGGLTTALQQIASSNGTSNTAILTLKNNVAISGTTAAATDYADIITVIGAGLF